MLIPYHFARYFCKCRCKYNTQISIANIHRDIPVLGEKSSSLRNRLSAVSLYNEFAQSSAFSVNSPAMNLT